ncbi:desmocollin 2-like protein isoform X2 [Chanos chanos]|uniref:Desmocollin 2-like protein isoform X2 n=1 Tax=Chanos chanos TaxID=29144 RepID=A0A6J2V315_CHACN|nr:desmocollin-2-like isoform X2 [Chanos chanos]
MSRGVLFCLGLWTVFCCSVESCVLRSVRVQVPEQLQAGTEVSKVNLRGCVVRELKTSDPDFFVRSDGTILTSHVTTVTARGRLFWVWVYDERGDVMKVDVSLTSRAEEPRRRSAGSAVLRRTKRRWSPLPFSITENENPPFPKEIDVIGSDSSVNYTVYYRIVGPGVTAHPVGVFSVDTRTGMLKVNKAVDREEFPQFVFTAHVYDVMTKKETDLPLPVTVIVKDVNDNAPEFTAPLVFTVEEQCIPDTVVGKVNATDKDEPNTPRTLIRYSLMNGTDLFFINSFNGVIKAKTSNLDRETKDKHYVSIMIKDMGGTAEGRSSTQTAVITVTDINDNPPTFREPLLKARVQENQADKLILRIPVDDKDAEGTPNWKAVFVIAKGNENGSFKIETDPKTNEGLLYVIKPLDHEKGEVVKLEIVAQNEAPLTGTTLSWVSVPVEITVGDEDEGPEFSPSIIQFRVKENVPNGTLIGTYTAKDPETKSSKGIKYYKISDPANWISLSESSGELRTANTVDRESDYVSNSMYNITVKAVDESRKTGTGTVMIFIEDVNDNMPRITEPSRVVCETGGTQGYTVVTADDPDLTPYSKPFTFELGEGADGKWRLKEDTSSSMLLEPAVDLPIGEYKVPLIVKDLQGFGEEQMVTVRVCECVTEEKKGEGVCKAQRHSASLGVWAVLAILLAFLLALLLCLLLMFVCSTAREKLYIDDGTGGMLLKSNTEAPGDEVEGALLLTPASAVDITTKGSAMEQQFGTGPAAATAGQQTLQGSASMFQNVSKDFMTTETHNMTDYYASGRYGTGVYGDMYAKYSSLSTFDTWKTNEIYLDKKLDFFGEEEDDRFAVDLLRVHGYEGEGSLAGSVGCCSNLSDQDNLDFLNSLGPKFKTLAEVCMNRRGEE